MCEIRVGDLVRILDPKHRDIFPDLTGEVLEVASREDDDTTYIGVESPSGREPIFLPSELKLIKTYYT